MSPKSLLLRLCYFTLGLISYGITPCPAFPIEKAVPENSKVKVVTSSLSLSPSCVGCVSTSCEATSQNNDGDFVITKVNYHVIGTSHFRCNSHQEVSALVRQKKPDGVVIELDPERLLRLTLDDAILRTTNTPVNAYDLIGNRWFGGDFLSAIETSKELDIPIFLGDEYPVETRQRFADTLLDVTSYYPDRLLMALTSLFRPRMNCTINSHSEILSVDVLGSFLEDPRKLLPLVASLSLPTLAVVSIISLDAAGIRPSSSLSSVVFETLVTLLSSLFSFIASCKVYNNLIADRDLVLASNAQRAATTMSLLRSNKLIRKRWTFPVNESEEKSTPEHILEKPCEPLTTAIPLFTLKNPLTKNSVRNLNLFEPRWLKMIDRLLLTTKHQRRSKGSEEDNGFPTSYNFTSSSQQRIIGCVTCTNKFYSAINVAKTFKNNQPPVFVEGRYADVIFLRRGRFGELTNVSEGSRPSGARKVRAEILGRDAFQLPCISDDKKHSQISVVREGYLTASGLRTINEDENTINTASGSTNNQKEINIVVVVGLLHANGVLDYLSRTHHGNNSINCNNDLL